MRNEQRTEALPIQLAVASASPSGWCDAIVDHATEDGLSLIGLDGDLVEVRTGAIASPGEPVAYHRVAELIATGTGRQSARVIA